MAFVTTSMTQRFVGNEQKCPHSLDNSKLKPVLSSLRNHLIGDYRGMNTTYMCMYIYTCNLKIGHGIFQYHYIHVCIIVHPSVIMASTLSIWGYIYTCTCIRVLYTHICTYVQVVYVYICTYVQHTYLCTQSVGLYYEMYIHIHTYIYAH